MSAMPLGGFDKDMRDARHLILSQAQTGRQLRYIKGIFKPNDKTKNQYGHMMSTNRH